MIKSNDWIVDGEWQNFRVSYFLMRSKVFQNESVTRDGREEKGTSK